MIKYLMISTVNTFFYLLFFSFVFMCFDSDFSFLNYSSSLFIMCGFLIVLGIPWINGLYKNVIKNAYFKKKDILLKIIPMIVVVTYFIFKQTNYDNIIVSNLFKYLLYLAVLLQFIVFYDLLKNKTDIIERSTYLMETNNKHLTTDEHNLLGFDYLILNNMIKNYTNKKFYIIEDKNSIDYKDITFMIISGTSSFRFSYPHLMFMFDDKLISQESILSLQKEYKKFLFDMNDEELDILLMVQI